MTQKLDSTRLTPERGIEQLWKEARNSIYGTNLQDKDGESKIAKEMQCINVAYAIAKELFEGTNRNSGERYFEHLRETAKIIISKEISDSVSIFDVVLAILHDIIEDTNLSAKSIASLFSKRIKTKRGDNFGERISKALLKLSKNNWHNYIISPQERDFIKYYENGNPIPVGEEDDFPLDFFGKEKKNTSEHKRYQAIKSKAKELRNIDYFGSLEELSDTELKVKFADRLHNLRTQWDPKDKEQVEKKVKETKQYFLPIARKRNPKAYKKLVEEIKRLEDKLGYTVEFDEIIEDTKCWANKALEFNC